MLSTNTLAPNGISNAAPWQTMASAGLPDPTWGHTYVTDFDTFNAADWTITRVGTGTQALTPFDGGALLLTNSAGATDSAFFQLVNASFKLLPPHETFFKFAGMLSDVVNCVFYCGLLATTVTPFTPGDGVYILKATGQAALSLNVVIGGVTTTFPLPASAVLVANTYFELGLHMTITGGVEVFFNPTTGHIPPQPPAGAVRGYATQIPAPAAGLTQVLLNPSFGLLNSTAAGRTLTTDYVVASRC